MKERTTLLERAIVDLETAQLLAINTQIKSLKRQQNVICFLAGLAFGIIAVWIS